MSRSIRELDKTVSALKEYYKLYLIHVRGLKESTVRHYFNSLRTASRFLADKKFVRNDIYEVVDLQQLHQLREILYADPEFIELDRRGNRMYSAGLNNYCRFAEGNDFMKRTKTMEDMDIPVGRPDSYIKESPQWKRSGILRTQALAAAHYTCEVNVNHHSFIARSNQKPYMEGHHLVPLNAQNDFNYSLDVYANVVCLCPVCHRMLHYGCKRDIEPVLERFWKARHTRLEKSGLLMTEGRFMDLALRDK